MSKEFTLEQYLDLKQKVIEAGYENEIYQMTVYSPPETKEQFFDAYMRTVVDIFRGGGRRKPMYDKAVAALAEGRSLDGIVVPKGKKSSIEKVVENLDFYFEGYKNNLDDIFNWLQTLPFVGEKNAVVMANILGIDTYRPNNRVPRLARACGMKASELLEDMKQKSGDKKETINSVIWRADLCGIINWEEYE